MPQSLVWMQTSSTPACVLQNRSTVSSSRIRITSFNLISEAWRAKVYPPFVPRCDFTRPALFKIHMSLPAFATDKPSRSASWARVSDSSRSSARASCTRHRKPYSSWAEIFIEPSLEFCLNLSNLTRQYRIPDFLVKYLLTRGLARR